MIRFSRIGTSAIAFAKKNSGALIIGVSLVIGLNFNRFTNYASEVPYAIHLAIYHLSGQAAADEKAQREYEQEQAKQRQEYEQERAKQRQEYEQEQAKRTLEYQQQQAKRAQESQQKQAQIELTRILAPAWQQFLTANRATFKQIDLIKDSQNGDYSCLQIRNNKWDFVSPYKSDAEIRAAEQKAEVSTYPVRDGIADEFVQWLNDNMLSGKTDWKYEDLQNMDQLEFHIHNYSCWTPKVVWRANRYQKRIE
jgi:hypothetical protein